MSACCREADDDLAAPGKVNISSHYNAATESENAIMTTLGWREGGTWRERTGAGPAAVHLGVPVAFPVPQELVLTLPMGRWPSLRPLPWGG